MILCSKMCDLPIAHVFVQQDVPFPITNFFVKQMCDSIITHAALFFALQNK